MTMRCRDRFGKRADAFLGGAGNDVLLLEFAARLEEDQRDLVGEVVLQLRADVLVGALGVARHPLEVRLDLGVVVDDEVIGFVRPPLEVVVARPDSCRSTGCTGSARRREVASVKTAAMRRREGRAACGCS